MNINMFMQMFRSGGNPQQIITQMLQSQAAQNPMYANLLTLDEKGIEEYARNLAKEKGLNFDEEFKKFKQTYHL